jgi:pimeloyl-ACP methyl ester carboxylesterase
MQPETRYASSGGVNIAYQVLGTGPHDLVFVLGWVSNIEGAWEQAALARFLTHLSSFSRLILFDKRGTGLSDRVTEMPSLEVRMDDVRAVMDAADSDRAALFGLSEGGPMCALFSATYPDRTSALIMAGSYARRTRAPDYPWGPTKEEYDAWIDQMRRDWGKPFGLDARAPSMAHDQRFRDWWSHYLRISASPSAVVTLTRMNGEIDVRHVLPTIRVPTLILHCAGDRAIDIGGSRYMAQQIPQAKLIELPGSDHFPWLTNADVVLGEIEEFLTGTRHAPEPDRVLATVLFTDIVDSTKRAAEMGDPSWHRLLDEHDRTAHWIVEKYRGSLVRTTGDGILATFDGPGRAIRCALDFETAATQIGLSLRAGLHTGEVERRDRDIGGVAVHAAARVMALSGPGEVLVSRVVTDLVAGAGLKFSERGSYELKGLPGRWDLFAAST